MVTNSAFVVTKTIVGGDYCTADIVAIFLSEKEATEYCDGLAPEMDIHFGVSNVADLLNPEEDCY